MAAEMQQGRSFTYFSSPSMQRLALKCAYAIGLHHLKHKGQIVDGKTRTNPVTS